MIHINEWKWHLNYIPVNLSIYLNVCLFMKRDALSKVLHFILLFNNLEGMAGRDDSLLISCSGNLWKWFLKDQIQRWKICWWIDTVQVFEWWSLLWVRYNSSVSLRLVDMFNLIHSFIFFFFKEILLFARHCSRQ